MLDPALKTTFNSILDGCAELEETRLELAKGEARVQVGLYPEERGFERDPEWRRLALSGVSAVLCWTGDEELPAELRFGHAASDVYMAFVGSLFKNEWIYDWDLFTEAAPFLLKPATWSWVAGEDWQQQESLFLHLERTGGAVWTLGIWFADLEIETPLETRQSLKDFVEGWRFLSETLS